MRTCREIAGIPGLSSPARNVPTLPVKRSFQVPPTRQQGGEFVAAGGAGP